MKKLLQFILSVVFTLTLVDYLKEIFKVERPVDALVKLNDYAFPSGHSATSFAILTFFIYHIAKGKMSKLKKGISISLLTVISILIAGQRLMIKVHTWDQVIVGALLGVFVSLVTIRFVNLIYKNRA